MKDTKGYEGFTAKAFNEKGGRKSVRTVGSGINVDEAHNQDLLPADVVSGKREITPAENKKAYDANMAIASKDAKNYVGKSWDDLDPEAQSILTDMHFNMGGPRMAKFKGLQKAAQSGDYGRMADEIQYSNADDKKEETPYFQQTKGRAKDHVNTLRTLTKQKNLGTELTDQLEAMQ